MQLCLLLRHNGKPTLTSILLVLALSFKMSYLAMIPTRCHAFSAFPTISHRQRRYPTEERRAFEAHIIELKSINGGGDDKDFGRLDKGFNLLELASQVVPQGRIVETAKESWKFLWQRFMVELAPQDSKGNYQRPSYGFSSTLGSKQHPIPPKNSEDSKRLAQRYSVYVGNPCPWCHRVRLVANILGLESKELLDVTVLFDDPVKASRGGWVLDKPPHQAAQSGIKDLRQLYDYLSPGYQGRCTAPLLVDWESRTIVSNESKDIVRMLPLLLQSYGETHEETNNQIELCPADLQNTIEETNEWIYRLLNNGVYRCGFSTSQFAYDQAASDVRRGLDRCEEILSQQKYLCSDSQFTESDVLLLPTLLRFDAVYAPFFRAGGAHLRLECDYPNTFRWLKHCWNEIDGVKDSIDLEDACESYFRQLFPLNPGGILPTPISAKSLRLE